MSKKDQAQQPEPAADETAVAVDTQAQAEAAPEPSPASEVATAIERFGPPPFALPDLAGVATKDLVDVIEGNGNFKPSYINWARTMNLLHKHAPGWLPEALLNAEGGLVHRASGVGGCLHIRFVQVGTGLATPFVPQAVMDHKNNSVPLEKISARDESDTFVRGVCKAAALTFGLAYELWAKIPLESGYGDGVPEEKQQQKPRGPLPPQDHVVAINGAKTMEELQRAFAVAWHEYRHDPDQQSDFKTLYDDRKSELGERQ